MATTLTSSTLPGAKPQFAPQPPVCWLCGNRHNLHPVQYYTGGMERWLRKIDVSAAAYLHWAPTRTWPTSAASTPPGRCGAGPAWLSSTVTKSRRQQHE